jgi:hypothetical protein
MNLIPYIHRLNLANFYRNNEYLTLSKWFSNIKYVNFGNEEENNYNFKIFSYFIVFQQIVTVIILFFQNKNVQIEDISYEKVKGFFFIILIFF